MYNKDEQVAALEKRVKELEDNFSRQSQAYEKWKREMRDLLYNLGADNFDGVYLKQQDGKFAKISVDADGIRAMVGAVVNGLDGKTYTGESQFNMSAGEINSSVKQVIKDIGDDISSVESTASSEITQTANDISMKVATIFGDITTVTVLPDEKDVKKVYCVVDADKNPKSYHYYDGSKWIESDSPVIFSLFKQTSTGFELVGNVIINGNVITNGKISASEFVTEGAYGVLIIGNGAYGGGAGKILFKHRQSGSELFELSVSQASDDALGFEQVNFGAKNSAYLDIQGCVNFKNAQVHGIYAKFAPDENVTLTEADTEETTAEAETVTEG